MKHPLIGIITRTEMNNGTYKHQVNTNYFEPFTKRGVSAIVISLLDPNLSSTLSLCDGILLPGGDDVDPSYYGEENHGLSKGCDLMLDELDRKALLYAVKNKVPVLGICRGIQSIAAFLGGSLYQDIDEAGLAHNVQEKTHLVETIRSHPLTDSFLDQFVTNSFHHQAVKIVPDGFVVIFKHQDVIEGIIHQTLPILGVQWHPERLDTKESNLIFDIFVKWVKEYHETR